MISRLYALLFVLIVVGGMFFQRRYMRSSTQEIHEIEQRLREDTILVDSRDFVLQRYSEKLRSERLEAKQGHIMTSGRLSLEGNVRIYQYEDNRQDAVLRSKRATGHMNLPTSELTRRQSGPLTFEEMNPSESLRFPEKVNVTLADGEIDTSDLYLDLSQQLLNTTSMVNYKGQGKALRGEGMSYKLSTGEFELGGPVSGVFDPVVGRSSP